MEELVFTCGTVTVLAVFFYIADRILKSMETRGEHMSERIGDAPLPYDYKHYITAA